MADPRVLLAVLWSLLSAFATGAPLQADDEAEQWFARMVSAGQQAHYTGRSIYRSGDADVISLEVRHAVFDGEAWERIIHLSEHQTEILRRGQKVSCLHPDDQAEFNLGQLSNSLQHPFLRDNFVLPAYYRLVKGGEGRVAGRKVWQLDILPEDRLRYGFRLWLDAQTALLLKSVTLDQRGDELELFEFVQIDFDAALTKAGFEPSEGLAVTDISSQAGRLETGARPASHAQGVNSDLGDQFAQPDWRLSWLPRGFELAANASRPIAGQRVSSQVFSDGLAAFTVFLEPVGAAAGPEGSQARGATIAVSRQVQHQQQTYLVTIVGEVPMETAIQVAASVVFN